jgi:hypothetical protein
VDPATVHEFSNWRKYDKNQGYSCQLRKIEHAFKQGGNYSYDRQHNNDYQPLRGRGVEAHLRTELVLHHLE